VQEVPMRWAAKDEERPGVHQVLLYPLGPGECARGEGHRGVYAGLVDRRQLFHTVGAGVHDYRLPRFPGSWTCGQRDILFKNFPITSQNGESEIKNDKVWKLEAIKPIMGLFFFNDKNLLAVLMAINIYEPLNFHDIITL
jgi:hypothetical protein